MGAADLHPLARALLDAEADVSSHYARRGETAAGPPRAAAEIATDRAEGHRLHRERNRARLAWALAGSPGSRPTDSDTGLDRAPDRYMAAGRETIDRIRDALGDEGFVAFCAGNAMKYDDRAGRKGDEATDREKATFYRCMANHVRSYGPDPRHGRPGFVSYHREDDS